MPHTLKTFTKHPHRNPMHRFGQGRERWTEKLLDFRTGQIREFTMLGPKNPTRWLPHQGKREMKRREGRIS